MKKKLISIFISIAIVGSLFVGCDGPSREVAGNSAKETNAEMGASIGVAMPTKDLQRWNQDGENMKSQLEDAGYTVDLQYANNDATTQATQIETMISSDIDILVIAAVDGQSLETPLALAKEMEIPVIAYDRLIMNSDAVSYYATFDNYAIGQKQGEYIEEILGLEYVGDTTFNMEIFAGDPKDNNAKFFYGGAMDVLRKYINAGVINVPSGDVEFAEVATREWSTEKAQVRMNAILSSNYIQEEDVEEMEEESKEALRLVLDAVLCSNDSTALGVTNAIEEFYQGKYPIITGQDCDVANVKNMLVDKQAMNIFKDTRILAAQVVNMVEAILTGSEVEVNDEKTYDNGTGIIPTFLCEPVVTTKDNYREILIDSEYYKESDLQ
jgi:ABC-type xylose transport system, periplasmic component